MKRKNKAFTMVELLTVIGVIALLIGLLIPALTMVRNLAKKTQQKVQFTTIGLAISAFKSDYGDYPPSGPRGGDNKPYCGAQQLAEALLGWDLLGFHPDSVFRSDGRNASNTEYLYPVNLDPSNPTHRANLEARRGSYLDVETANAFTLDDLFVNTTPLEKERFVLCDVFGVKKITITQSGGKRVTFKAGTPILYYKANISSKVFHSGFLKDRIYNSDANIYLIRLGVLPDLKPTDWHPLVDPAGSGRFFYEEDYKIVDPKASASMAADAYWPYRPDSYILISAGADGLYGTGDDITNFGN